MSDAGVPARQARLVDLPEHTDARGALVVAEFGAALPFRVMRARWIHSVAPGATRGGHGHRATEQLFVAVAGRATMITFDGREEKRIVLDSPAKGLHVPPMIWTELHDFSPGTVVLLLSSTVFEEADYVKDRGELQT